MSPWSGKKHYKEFLEDMISNINIKEDEIEVTQYFMWTMLFVGEKINHVKNLFMLLMGRQQRLTIVWGIERSGFFNGREKWAKGFENQRV